MKKKRLGEVLRERGSVSATDLSHALQEQQGKLVHLGELLLQGGSVSKKDLIAALGEVTSVPYFDCSKVQVPADVLEAIPAGMAWRFNVLPVRLADKSLTVVLDEPQNLQIIDELRFKTGKSSFLNWDSKAKFALRSRGITVPTNRWPQRLSAPPDSSRT
jgi:type IV pilus assembly protein PilB